MCSTYFGESCFEGNFCREGAAIMCLSCVSLAFLDGDSF